MSDYESPTAAQQECPRCGRTVQLTRRDELSRHVCTPPADAPIDGWAHLTIPPAAEPAQQDDERDDLRAEVIECMSWAENAAIGRVGPEWADALLTRYEAALAARPSADTERWRRVRELADEWEADSDADYASGIGSAINRRAASRLLRAALDGEQ